MGGKFRFGGFVLVTNSLISTKGLHMVARQRCMSIAGSGELGAEGGSRKCQ